MSSVPYSRDGTINLILRYLSFHSYCLTKLPLDCAPSTSTLHQCNRFFFWLLSKFCSLGTAQALGFLSEEDIVLSFWMSSRYGAWYDFYDRFDQDSSHDGRFCAQITATSPNILQENSTS